MCKEAEFPSQPYQEATNKKNWYLKQMFGSCFKHEKNVQFLDEFGNFSSPELYKIYDP